MASITYVNPYDFILTDYFAGLDSVAATLAPLYPNQTINNLVDSVYAYVQTTYFDSPDLRVEKSLKALINSIINGYINVQSGEYLLYQSGQMAFIYDLIEGTASLSNPEDIKQHILNVEQQIVKSPLTASEQLPLLYATAVGKASYDYWASVINGLPANNWAQFVTSFAPTIVKFPGWINASMEGTLIAFSLFDNQSNDKPGALILDFLGQYEGANIIFALFGCLSVGGGKAAFNLQQVNYSQPVLV